ncbi:hypothetical protein EKG37_19100 [Robertmurraya yapensis]|uniref:Uncharacterized protein n=1 Tax=Bacillus yapensis TaxID=2492960 RepID=A0A3S0KIN1_9BACI|nr:hypothetical protein EKG37_19100 [Bacillus yapensis]
MSLSLAQSRLLIGAEGPRLLREKLSGMTPQAQKGAEEAPQLPAESEWPVAEINNHNLHPLSMLLGQ